MAHVVEEKQKVHSITLRQAKREIQREFDHLNKTKQDFIDLIVSCYTKHGDTMRFVNPDNGEGMHLVVNNTDIGCFVNSKLGLVFRTSNGHTTDAIGKRSSQVRSSN